MGDPKVYPEQIGYIAPPASAGSSLGFFARGLVWMKTSKEIRCQSNFNIILWIYCRVAGFSLRSPSLDCGSPFRTKQFLASCAQDVIFFDYDPSYDPSWGVKHKKKVSFHFWLNLLLHKRPETYLSAHLLQHCTITHKQDTKFLKSPLYCNSILPQGIDWTLRQEVPALDALPLPICSF